MDVDCGTVGCVFLKEAMILAMFVGLTVLCEEVTTVCFCLRGQMFKQWEAGHKNSRLDLFWKSLFFFMSDYLKIWATNCTLRSWNSVKFSYQEPRETMTMWTKYNYCHGVIELC